MGNCINKQTKYIVPKKSNIKTEINLPLTLVALEEH